jgi:hypothetical protein
MAFAAVVEQLMVEQEARQVRRLAIEAATPRGEDIELTGEREFHPAASGATGQRQLGAEAS